VGVTDRWPILDMLLVSIGISEVSFLSIAFAQAREQPIAPGRADSRGTLG
jgi:hypothetical protein